MRLIDRNNYHLFQPLLYQVACAALAPADIAQPIRTILREQKNVSVMLAEVEHIDLERRTLSAGGREVPYDYLVLAARALAQLHELVEIGRLHFGGLLAWFACMALHITVLIGFRNRLAVLSSWIYSSVFFRRGSRLITRTVPPGAQGPR